MLSLRLALVSALLMVAIACGDSYSPPPASPTPAPTPAPAPAPAPTPGVLSAAVAIPVGAEFLGNRAFIPAELNVAVGTTVTWTNNDSTSHTSTSNAVGWNSGIVQRGREFSFAFQNAGTFPYHCDIHPGMVGTVVVR